MRWVRFLVLAGLALAAAVRWPAGLTAAGAVPWWPFLVALLYGLQAPPGAAAGLAFGVGLLVDLASLSPPGLNAVVFGAAALVLARVRGLVFAAHPLTQGILALLLAAGASMALLLCLAGAEPTFRLGARLPAAALLSLVTGALFPLLAAADGRLGLTAGFREVERGV